MLGGRRLVHRACFLITDLHSNHSGTGIIHIYPPVHTTLSFSLDSPIVATYLCSASANEVSNMAWALAELGHYSPAMFDHMAERLLPQTPEAEADAQQADVGRSGSGRAKEGGRQGQGTEESKWQVQGSAESKGQRQGTGGSNLQGQGSAEGKWHGQRTGDSTWQGQGTVLRRTKEEKRLRKLQHSLMRKQRYRALGAEHACAVPLQPLTRMKALELAKVAWAFAKVRKGLRETGSVLWKCKACLWAVWERLQSFLRERPPQSGGAHCQGDSVLEQEQREVSTVQVKKSAGQHSVTYVC